MAMTMLKDGGKAECPQKLLVHPKTDAVKDCEES